MGIFIFGVDFNTNTFFGEHVNKQWAGSGVDGSTEVDISFVLVFLDLIHVLIKEESRVEWTALGFGVELGREDGFRSMDHAFIRLIIQVDEIRFPISWKGRSINGIAVVLGSDVTVTRHEIQSRNVVSTVSVLNLTVLAPAANARSWWPRQIPKMGPSKVSIVFFKE